MNSSAPPDEVDFRRSLPPTAPRLRDALTQSLRQIASNEGLGALMHEGRSRADNRERLAAIRLLAPRLGAELSPDRVFMTNGAQSAFVLLLRELVGSSGLLLAEALTYGSLRPLAQKCAIRLKGVAIDREGILPDAFEQACRVERPRALYCNPTLHNPTTAVMSLARRWSVIEIARKYGVTIVEDEALARLYPHSPQPLASLAPDICWYVMSTSKCLTHGLRLAYVVGPSVRETVAMFGASAQLSFWVPMPLALAITTAWIESGLADAISADIALECRARQEAAARILDGFDVRAPPGAMHIWLTLPRDHRADDFARLAQANGVLLRPASHFAADDRPAPDCVRLSLSTARDLSDVRTGLTTLRGLLERGRACSDR